MADEEGTVVLFDTRKRLAGSRLLGIDELTCMLCVSIQVIDEWTEVVGVSEL